MNRPALGLAALLVAVVAVYAPSLGNGFVWDDVAHIADNPRLDSLAGVWGYAVALEGPYHRPAIFAGYAFETALWGRWAPAFHATNLLLHLLNVALVAVAARRTGVAPWTALGGAAVFALHPLQVEAVAYISGRTDLLMTFGALAGTVVLLGRGAPLARGAVAAACGGLAIASKESGFALAALWPWLVLRHEPVGAARWRLLLPPLVVAGLLLMLRPDLPALADGGDHLARLAGAGQTLLTYLRLLIQPSDLQVDRLTVLTAPAVGLLLCALAVPLALLGLSRRGRVGDWSAWSIAFYAPVSNLLPLYPAIAQRALFTPEHNLYAPLAGIGLLLAVGVERLLVPLSTPLWRRLAAMPFLLPLVAWAAIDTARLPDWHDEARLFGSALALGSESPRVWYNAGTVRLARGDAVGAAQLLAGAAARAPHDAAALTNLGVARQQSGDLIGAEAAYAKALALAPDDAQLLENIGTLALRRRDPAGARRAFSRAVALDASRARSRRAIEALDRIEAARP